MAENLRPRVQYPLQRPLPQQRLEEDQPPAQPPQLEVEQIPDDMAVEEPRELPAQAANEQQPVAAVPQPAPQPQEELEVNYIVSYQILC